MTHPLNPPARRGARAAPSPSAPADVESPTNPCWTLDPGALEATRAFLYTRGGHETRLEVIAWTARDPWPDADADEGWTSLFGDGIDPHAARVAVPAHCSAMIRRRERHQGPESPWQTMQAFRATPGAVALTEDALGVWIAIDGVVRGARVRRPWIVTERIDPETGHPVTSYRMGTLDGLAQHTGLWQLALIGDDHLQYPAFVRDFPQLRALDLSHCSYLSGLDVLEALPDLESLRLRWCDEGDFWHGSLRALHGLRALDVSFTGVTDLRFLRELRQLAHLDLEGHEGIRDLRPLSRLKGLRTLDLSRCTQLRDLAPLGAHPSLETLRLQNAHDDLDLSALATIPTLRLLDLRECHARRGCLRRPRRKVLAVLQARRAPAPRRKRWHEPPGPRLYAGDVVRVNHGYEAPKEGRTVMETTIESLAFHVSPRIDEDEKPWRSEEELIWHGEVMHVRAGTVPAGATRIRPAQGCRVWCPTRGVELYARRDAFEVITPSPRRSRARAVASPG